MCLHKYTNCCQLYPFLKSAMQQGKQHSQSVGQGCIHQGLHPSYPAGAGLRDKCIKAHHQHKHGYRLHSAAMRIAAMTHSKKPFHSTRQAGKGEGKPRGKHNDCVQAFRKSKYNTTSGTSWRGTWRQRPSWRGTWRQRPSWRGTWRQRPSWQRASRQRPSWQRASRQRPSW